MLKFLRISSLYPDILEEIEKKIDKIKNENYEELQNKIFKEMYSVSNNISKSLKKNGFQCFEIIENAKFTQNKWIEEFGDKSSKETIIMQQIKFYQPDILFIGNSSLLSKDFFEKIKELKFIKLILSFHCAPFNNKININLKLVDGVVTCTEGYKRYIHSNINSNVLLMKHAFPKNTNIDLDQKRNIDITFVGSIFINEALHNKRVNLIYQIMKNFKNNYIAINFSKKFILQYFYYFIISVFNFKIFKNYSFFYKIIYIFAFSKKPVYGKDMLRVLSKSKILINTHIDDTEYAGNMRIFEGTGCGCLLISDVKKGIEDLFKIDHEILLFNNVHDLITKCNFMLGNQKKIEQMASLGKQRTQKDHHYENRAELLAKFINDLIKIKS